MRPSQEGVVTLYRARWVLPVGAPEMEDGAVAVRAGIIIDLGPSKHIFRVYRGKVVNLGDTILMPGFVNAHTHLELSALKGKVETGNGFVDWVRQVLRKRQELSLEEVTGAIESQVQEICASGTVLLGDVANTGVSYRPLNVSGLRALLFHELIGFRGEDAEEIFHRYVNSMKGVYEGIWLQSTLCAHGPHSVSPKLLQNILAYLIEAGKVTSIHVAESEEEDLFIREGTGPFREFLEERGAWDPAWRSWSGGPVSYLDRMGFLRRGTLCVHLVQASREDLRILAERGAAACVCPRSNVRTGVGQVSVETMLNLGLCVTLGTDSLASNDDLNVFREAQYLFGANPGISPEALVRMFTLNGAVALGWPGLGSLEKGRLAKFAMAPVSCGRCEDPYEYLLECVKAEEIKVL